MRINEFFSRRLRVPLYHHVWSWGAFDRTTNRIFLRVNEDSVVEDDDQKEWVKVYDPDWTSSAGHSERLKQIDALRHGASGFAVTVRFNDKDKIASFNHETLLVLGKVVEENGLTFAQVIGRRPVEEIVDADSEFSSTAGDVERILKSAVTKTERRALVDARLGQGAFRSVVLSQWDYRCAVMGVSVTAAIRASHIKPWKVSSDAERLAPSMDCPWWRHWTPYSMLGSFHLKGAERFCCRLRSLARTRNFLALELCGCEKFLRNRHPHISSIIAATAFILESGHFR